MTTTIAITLRVMWHGEEDGDVGETANDWERSGVVQRHTECDDYEAITLRVMWRGDEDGDVRKRRTTGNALESCDVTRSVTTT